jgi:tripartite-type tricarboxylate transporter receptor subunit TctC
MRPQLIGFSLAALMCAAAGAHAQDAAYPSRPVTLVVPTAAGSSTDTIARFFADHLARRLSQPFVVEPTPGGGGTVGVTRVLSRPADGYTVLVGTSATNAANFSLFKTLPYTPADFAPVACLYLLPPVVAVGAHVPAKTVAELVALAKASPGKLTYGYGSSSNKIGAELFKARAGVDILGVPYKGAQQVIGDILGGRIDMNVESATTVVPHAEKGTMRILAVLSEKRLASMPDVPTIAEAGLANAVMTPWVGVFVKAGTPQPIVDKLNAAYGAVLATPEYAQLEGRAKSQSFMCSPAELGAFAQKEVVRWADLAKIANIERE